LRGFRFTARLGRAVLAAGLRRRATLDLLAATTAPALARRTLALGRARGGVRRGRWPQGRGGVAGDRRRGGDHVGGRLGFARRPFGTRPAGTLLAPWAGIAAATAGARTAAAAAAAALLVGGALLARLAEDLADALDLLAGDPLARLARQRLEQVRVDLLDRDLLLDEALDVRQPHRVALAGEADRVALRAQARGAADAVHVVLGVERQVVVVDVADAVDVQAARGHVGRHQDLQLAGLELLQQRLALLLRHVARQHADPVTGALQRPRHPLHPHLGVDEHHGPRALAAREQAEEQRDLLLVGREVDLLPDLGRGDELGLDHDLLGLVHVLVGELQHPVAEGGREQQGLALGADRHAPQQEADVLDEAEVEHAVGLVEHADLAGVQAHDLVLLDVVDQAPGGGDDHVGAGLQDRAACRSRRRRRPGRTSSPGPFGRT
jgi:hypothetical protein